MTRYSTASFTVVAITLAILAGCGTSETPGPAVDSATQSPAPSSAVPAPVEGTSPAADASPIPSGGPENALGPDGIAQVVTTDLVVRSLPVITDASEILEPALDEPMLLYIADGPVGADGYDWYQVQPFGMHYLDLMAEQPPFGWVAAASRAGEPWIAPKTLECPEPEIEVVRAMADIARLACYGDQELTIDGSFGGCFISDPAPGTPEWLFQTGCLLVPGGYIAGVAIPDPGGLPMRFVGEVGIPFDEPMAPIRVTGHFDDPAASTCKVREIDGDWADSVEPMEPAQAVLYCRAQFAVTSVQRVGA